MATAENNENGQRAALLSLDELQGAITRYASTLNEEVKEGRTFDDVAALLKEASAAVASYGEKVAEERKIGSVAVPQAAAAPAKKATDLLSSALTSIAALSVTVAEFDHRHHLTTNAYATIASYLERATTAISGLRSQAQTASAAATSNVEHSLSGVKATLQELLGTVQAYSATIATEPRVEKTLAALDRARSLITAAVDQLKEAPMADKPSVATHELLALSRTAINAVTEALPPQVTAAIDRAGSTVTSAAAAAASAVSSVPQPSVASTVHLASQAADTVKQGAINAADNAKFAALRALTVAKEKAQEAVDAAATQFGGFQERALGVASSAVDSAIRKAASLDTSYSVTERLVTLNESYGVTDKVMKTVSSAKALGEQYGVADKAAAAVNKAKGWDESLTGGKGAAVAESAIAIGTTALNAVLGYAGEVANKYSAAKAQEGTQASARAEEAVQQAEQQSADVIAKATATA